MKDRIVIVILWALVLFVAAYTFRVYADPLVQAKAGGVTVTLYTEDCQLKEITNLPKRAVWTENGKDFEGCWAVNPDLRVVIAYFSDKTATALPMQIFQRVTGA